MYKFELLFGRFVYKKIIKIKNIIISIVTPPAEVLNYFIKH